MKEETSLPTWEDFQKILALRKQLFKSIGQALEEDSHCKSYEGKLEIVMPNYFESRNPKEKGWGLNLSCYVLGPSRHYEWRGKTLQEAIEKAEKDITFWGQELENPELQ